MPQNDPVQISQDKLPTELKHEVAELSANHTLENLLTVNKDWGRVATTEYQRRLSDGIVEYAEDLLRRCYEQRTKKFEESLPGKTHRNVAIDFLNGFNGLRDLTQSMPESVFRTRALDRLEELVPSNILNDLNEFDRGIQSIVCDPRRCMRPEAYDEPFNSMMERIFTITQDLKNRGDTDPNWKEKYQRIADLTVVFTGRLNVIKATLNSNRVIPMWEVIQSEKQSQQLRTTGPSNQTAPARKFAAERLEELKNATLHRGSREQGLKL
jgi:hypothetical protein